MKWLLLVIAGGLFGAGLTISGMTDPAKVIGFLDVSGDWDPALAFVMGGAVLTFAIGLLLLRKFSGHIPSCNLPDTRSEPVSKRLVIGSAIFGIGWGLSGFCPGPAIANLSVLRMEALYFVPLMLLGMLIAQRVFQLDK